MGFFSDVLDMLFPPKCIFCRGFLAKGEEHICAKCIDELPFTKGGETSVKGDYFDVCIAPLKYDGDVRRSLLRYKFKGATQYAEYYGVILGDCIREHFEGKYDLISWVPLSSGRKRSRGYDQAMLLACAAALQLDNVAVETLSKDVEAEAQSGVGGKEQRRANISGAYSVPDPELIEGQRILLIDDIVTTGATLSECARTLLMAGAEAVICAALARA